MHKFVAIFALTATPLLAEVPRVMTDIAPIHSLTAMVMGEIASPGLLLPPGASPHDWSLRPSDARSLGEADLVIWVGEGLTPWLEEPLEVLAPDAQSLELLHTDGWQVRAAGELKDEDHAHKGHGHEGHDHGDIDPHAWLDPTVGQAWIGHIAETLADLDAVNAQTYRDNARKASADLVELDQQMKAMLPPTDRKFYVPHDAYGYFARHYQLSGYDFIAGTHASNPGAARISDLRQVYGETDAACLFTDGQSNPKWSKLVAESQTVAIVELDSLGQAIEPGPALYAQLIRGLGDSLGECLGQ